VSDVLFEKLAFFATQTEVTIKFNILNIQLEMDAIRGICFE